MDFQFLLVFQKMLNHVFLEPCQICSRELRALWDLCILFFRLLSKPSRIFGKIFELCKMLKWMFMKPNFFSNPRRNLFKIQISVKFVIDIFVILLSEPSLGTLREFYVLWKMLKELFPKPCQICFIQISGHVRPCCFFYLYQNHVRT